jgi:DNA-binding GntR family transcriptional regulator
MSSEPTRRGNHGAAISDRRPVERAYQLLKGRLLEGHYRSRERLAPDEIAAELGVSRQPVFDALRKLATEGLVDITPQVGCRVASYELSEIRDFFALLAGLGGTAAAIAASRRTDSDVADLKAINARIAELAQLPDSADRAREYRLENREFHTRVHRICGTQIVELLCSTLYDRSDFMINVANRSSPFGHELDALHAGHERLISAIEAGDADAARRLTEEHLRAHVELIEQAPEAV